MMLPRGTILAHLIPAGIIVAVATLAALPAAAQMPGASKSMANNAKPLVAPKPQQQPAALPGAAGGEAAVDRGAVKQNLTPKDALFDAVNRGDLPAAREAVNRGADVDARGILGLTALELSVDLGRNPITFFLLSVRSGTDPSVERASTTSTATSAVPKRVAAAQPVVATPAPAAAPMQATRPATPAPIRPVASGDPGTPAPQAGFLGFGRPTN